MGQIAEGAVIPITKSWEKAYAAWGESEIERINALMHPAAELVASSPGCDRLETLGLSERSMPPENIVFYADCANGNRFFITGADVLQGRKSVSQNDKSKWLNNTQLIEISQEAVKAKQQQACIFLRSSVYRAVVGRTVVTLEFSAVNDAEVNIAKCYFDGLSLRELEIGTK